MGTCGIFSLFKALRITDGEEPLPQIMVDGKADGEVLIVLINFLSLQNFQLIIKWISFLFLGNWELFLTFPFFDNPCSSLFLQLFTKHSFFLSTSRIQKETT